MAMSKVLTVAAIAEALTGAALLVAPPFVCRLLLGEDVIGMAIPARHKRIKLS